MNIEEQVKNLIDCNCDEAYKSRGLSAPDCPQCNYAEYVVELAESYAKERAVEFHTWYMNHDTFKPMTYNEWYDTFINQP